MPGVCSKLGLGEVSMMVQMRGVSTVLHQTKMGKLHLVDRSGSKTACGVKVGPRHYMDLTSEPWHGPDKCLRCRRALETGVLNASRMTA